MSRLQDKVAIVTGAGTGIGRAIALSFAREGAYVVAVGRRLEKVQETANLVAGEGGRAIAMSADVSKASDVARMMTECAATLGRVDILVNNAGVHVQGGILKVSEEQWDWVMAINLKGVFLCSKAVAPGMLERKWGRIINISSIAAVSPTINAAYGTSKGAVATLTRSMALELSAGGITVNAIGPGPTETEMTRGLAPDQRARQMTKMLVGHLGEPVDIAAGAVYLASEEARHVTGFLLLIDGGMAIA